MMLSQHGINSLSRGPKEVFFEFLSSVVAPETAAHMPKTIKDGVTYEYFDSDIAQAIYWFDGPISEVEFDVCVGDDVLACDYGIWDVAPVRAHSSFYGTYYTALIAKFSTAGYDSISFPAYSERNNSYYQERAAGSPTEYCKSINSSSSAKYTKPKHYKYEVIDNHNIRVTVTYIDGYSISRISSILLTYTDTLSLRYIRMQLEAVRSGRRDEFAFKNFRILYKG